MTESNDTWIAEFAGLSFEDAYRRLEETVSRLEQGELPLTDAELLHRQGMHLANRCQQLLTETELRISQVGDERPPDAPADAGRPADANDGWELPPPLDPDDPSLFDDDDVPF